MQAVRNTERGIEVTELPSPDPGAGVRVQVRAAGICGSDLHLIAMGPLAHTLGHEVAGVLDDGTPVAIEPYVPCDDCDLCRAGEPQLCRHAWDGAYGISVDGGMAEEIAVAERCLVPLSPVVDVLNASLVEPLAVTLHGVNRVSLEDGRLAVIGAGSIGLCATAVAMSLGFDVDVASRHDHQARAVEALGARPAVDGEYDAVVEAVGTESALARAVEVCRPGGTVVLVGTPWEGLALPGFLTQMKEVRVVPAMVYGRHDGEREIEAAARLLAERREIADVIITHRFPLADAAEAFRVAADRKSGAIKVVLEP